MRPFVYAFVIWIVLCLSAIVLGLIREILYEPWFGPLIAHQVGSIVFIMVILVLSYLLVKHIQLNQDTLILIGVMWLCLTITFEFLAGHYLFGHSWSDLLRDYNIVQGRLWLLVLFTLLIAPWLVGKFLKYDNANRN